MQMWEQSILAALLILSSSYCLSFPYHSHLFFIPSLPSPSPFYLHLLSRTIVTVLSYFSSLLSISLSFLLFLRNQMCMIYSVEEIGAERVCCRQCALCWSSNGCVYFLPSFPMQMSFPYLYKSCFSLFWLKELHHQCRHDFFFSFLQFAGLRSAEK